MITDIDGFYAQLPLPKHIDELAVYLAIDPAKDVWISIRKNAGRDPVRFYLLLFQPHQWAS